MYVSSLYNIGTRIVNKRKNYTKEKYIIISFIKTTVIVSALCQPSDLQISTHRDFNVFTR